VLIVSAFALTDAPVPARAASNPGDLTLFSAGNRYSGCPLGPAYTFCDQPLGTASQPEPFLIQSSAAVTGIAVSLQSVSGLSANFAAADFTIAGNTCTGNLAAGAQCEIDLEFSPTAPGMRQAALTLTDAQGDSLAINVEGKGNNLALNPPYGLSPGAPDNSFSYGGQPVNQATAPQAFTVTAGAAVTQIHVSLAPIPGLESEFASGGADFLDSDNCSALAAGGTCTANVEFTPTAVGLRAAALVATDAEGDTTTLYISGYGNNGRGGASQAGGLSFSFVMPGANTAACARVNYFGFCNEPVGGASPAIATFTLQNTTVFPGTQITGLSVPKGSVIAQGATAPDFTVQSTSCASALAANASCSITVAFTPVKSGLRQGAIVITDAQGDVAAVNLAGYGDDYSIATQLPTEVSVIPGGTANFNATLTPDNVFGMNGEQVTFACPTALPANTSCVVTPCPATITPGTTVSVKATLVTSSAKVVAPVPPSGCSSYGPSISALLDAPNGKQLPPPAARGEPVRSWPLDPAVLAFAAIGAISLLLVGFFAPAITARRRRAAFIIMSAGLAAAVLAGCHHHGTTITTATPVGTTNLTVLGNALDATGNSLNASRTFQVTLDVVTK
jgi:hypothetical protein